MSAVPLTSRAIVLRSSVPNDFLRSLDFATSPFETFTKTFEICRTSSRSFSLMWCACLACQSALGRRVEFLRHIHLISPLLDFVFIAGDLDVQCWEMDRWVWLAHMCCGETHPPRISFRLSSGVLWIHLSIYKIGRSGSVRVEYIQTRT